VIILRKAIGESFNLTLTFMHADLDCTPHHLFDQSAHILPYLMTGNGDFE
jgi:hypothetical protein